MWFGLLKVTGLSPVGELVGESFPLLATSAGALTLGLGETLIGLGLLLNIWPFLVNIILVLHLIATLGVFIFAPDRMFSPGFPVLTLEGEFVLKNIVLVAAGIVLLSHHGKKL